jgi:transcriptional adapter 3
MNPIFLQVPGSPGKRGLNAKDNRSVKKLKTFQNSKQSDSVKVVGIPKLKTENAAPSFDPLQNEQIRPISETAKPSIPKNETPNRFWAFVEPYCAPITPDDIKVSTILKFPFKLRQVSKTYLLGLRK